MALPHSFRLDGVWQKPADSRRIPGTLSVSRRGELSLRLIIDDLDAPRPAPGPIGINDDDQNGVVMLGQTSDGHQFTLWNGFLRRGNPWSHIFRSVGQKELYFNRGIEGICHDKPEELRFSRASVGIRILPGWLGHNNFRVEYPDTGGIWTTLQCARPTALEFPIEDGTTLSFGWDARGPAIKLHGTSTKVSIRPRMGIAYAVPKPLATCEADLTAVVSLIQLLSGRAVMYHGLRLMSPSAQTTFQDGKTIQNSLRVFGSRLTVSKSGRSRGPGSFLFSFPFVASRFGELVQSWWRLYRANEHALGAYFAVNRWSRSFADERFFVAASAAVSRSRVP